MGHPKRHVQQSLGRVARRLGIQVQGLVLSKKEKKRQTLGIRAVSFIAAVRADNFACMGIHLGVAERADFIHKQARENDL